jgi:hypothetical protein
MESYSLEEFTDDAQDYESSSTVRGFVEGVLSIALMPIAIPLLSLFYIASSLIQAR